MVTGGSSVTCCCFGHRRPPESVGSATDSYTDLRNSTILQHLRADVRRT
jgi:hypothetical protein